MLDDDYNTSDLVLNESWPPYKEPGRHDPLFVAVPITCAYAAILVTGLVGNVVTCVVISRNRKMHTPTNYYLFSLAVSDLLLLVVGVPNELYSLWIKYPYVLGEPYGQPLCRAISFAMETSANATVLTITAFTVERYMVICHPFHTWSIGKKLARAAKCIAVIWVLAPCLAFPQAIQFGVVEIQERDNRFVEICTLRYTFDNFENAFQFSTFLIFIVPMTVITALYLLIGLELRRSRIVKRPSDPGQDIKKDRNVVRMLVAVVVAFFICWAPFHTQRLTAVYGKKTESPSQEFLLFYVIITYVSGPLYYVSTTVNPLLYHTMSKKFRDAFKSTFAELCSPGHGNLVRDRSSVRRTHRNSSTRDTQLYTVQMQPLVSKRVSLLTRGETMSLRDTAEQEGNRTDLANVLEDLDRS